MSCGKSACYDDEERSYYQERLSKIKQVSPEELLDKLEKIQAMSKSIHKETTNGTRYLFRLLDDLVQISDFGKW